jgi:hypothetical protein
MNFKIIRMGKLYSKIASLFIITCILSISNLKAQSISVDLTKPTDTLFFKMDASTEEISNTANFKLAKGNKFNFGQVTMKAHGLNPFKLPKFFMNNKPVNAGIYFPNLDQDAIFTYNSPKDTGMLDIKSPIGENAAELNFIFSKKDLLEGDNEIKIAVSNKDNQYDLAITNLKLFLRAQLSNDNVNIPAEFPGGQKGWVRYLENNLDRDLPIKNGAPAGKYAVIVSFIVDKDGNINNVKGENDPGYGTKEEAERILKIGPKWLPASQNGVNKIYRHRQSIVFVVSSN